MITNRLVSLLLLLVSNGFPSHLFQNEKWFGCCNNQLILFAVSTDGLIHSNSLF